MRPARLRMALIACVAALSARAGAAERVVFCAARASVCLHPKETLGTSSAGGVWAVVDDQALRAATLAGEAPPSVLYFSRDEYERAVAGLGPAERGRAVSRRREVVSENVPAVIFGILHDDLVALAVASTDGPEAHLESILDSAVIIGGANRFATSRPAILLHELRESLAKLLVELPPGAGADGYRKEDAELARVEAEIENKATAPAAPYTSPERAYFLARLPPPARRDPSFVDEPWYGWRGGTIKLLRPDEAMTKHPWRNLAPRLVYYGRAPFLRDVAALTDAQMDQRLRARLIQVPDRELAEMIATIAFDHAVFARQCAGTLQKPAPWLARWRQVGGLDTQNLKSVLASSDRGASRERAARLAKLQADLGLAAALLHVPAGTTDDRSRLDQIAAVVSRMPN